MEVVFEIEFVVPVQPILLLSIGLMTVINLFVKIFFFYKKDLKLKHEICIVFFSVSIASTLCFRYSHLVFTALSKEIATKNFSYRQGTVTEVIYYQPNQTVYLDSKEWLFDVSNLYCNKIDMRQYEGALVKFVIVKYDPVWPILGNKTKNCVVDVIELEPPKIKWIPPQLAPRSRTS